MKVLKSILCGVIVTLLLIFLVVISVIGITMLPEPLVLYIASVFALVLMAGLFSILFYCEVFGKEG